MAIVSMDVPLVFVHIYEEENPGIFLGYSPQKYRDHHHVDEYKGEEREDP